ncbi:sushi, von Willebrand factor type A, EGF and pentraxin domain-containing protein 1-like [Halichondria panicea]|uniref:sushi, von Willebrand factor type A, EGF and pentraxin domain-containing protein 1-like n=1 Tax=Halichondria panicea TaxID=6063 RepID=UPI00312BBAD1
MAYTSFWTCAIFATLMLFVNVSTASGEHWWGVYKDVEELVTALGTAQHIEQCTPPHRILNITAVLDILELHHNVNVGVYPCPYTCLTERTVIVNSTFVGGTALYSCSPGYRVDGAAVLTCQSDSSWNNPVPTCRRACPVLDGIADGSVSKTDGDFVGSEARYSCNDGYGLVRESTLTCLSSGEWNGSPPNCYKLITCPHLDNPTNGFVTLNVPNGVGSLVSYRCSAGYALVGSDSRTCQLNGTWTHSDPQCKRICPTLSAPRNGDVNVSDYFVDGTTNFTCNEGFGMIGIGKIICEADGLWSQQPPVCNPVCSVPTKPDNGIIVSDGPYFIESNATFACEDGFGVNGNGNITCLSDMTWSGISPICDRVCGPLKQVLNSTLTVDSYFYNSEAIYQCNEGFIFKFSGSQTESRLTYCCLHAEYSDHLLEWVGDYDVVPDCEPVECSTRRLRLRYGTFSMTSHYYGGIVTYVCSYGYKLSSGPRTRRCSKDRIWEPRINPSCTEVPGNCSSLQQITAPVNGEVLITSHLYGGSASYKCNDGFMLMGDGIRNCTEGESTVKWSGSQPLCLNTEPNTESPEDNPEKAPEQRSI